MYYTVIYKADNQEALEKFFDLHVSPMVKGTARSQGLDVVVVGYQEGDAIQELYNRERTND